MPLWFGCAIDFYMLTSLVFFLFTLLLGHFTLLPLFLYVSSCLHLLPLGRASFHVAFHTGPCAARPVFLLVWKYLYFTLFFLQFIFWIRGLLKSAHDNGKLLVMFLTLLTCSLPVVSSFIIRIIFPSTIICPLEHDINSPFDSISSTSSSWSTNW